MPDSIKALSASKFSESITLQCESKINGLKLVEIETHPIIPRIQVNMYAYIHIYIYTVIYIYMNMYVHYTTLMNSTATYIFQILMPSSNFHTPCANLEILLHYPLAFDPPPSLTSKVPQAGAHCLGECMRNADILRREQFTIKHVLLKGIFLWRLN